MNKLRNALVNTISALEHDIISHNWDLNESCNCGVVVQAITGKLPVGVKGMFRLALSEAGLPTGESKTWAYACQQSCSVTGEPMTVVFKELALLGLSPKDISHLEFLDNPAILKESGIRTFFKKNYYKKRENLIRYLRAWVRIIDKESKRKKFTREDELEADFLIAMSLEDYEKAAEIKKSILKK